MSDSASSDLLCSCGHAQSEHDREYGWAPGCKYCSGHVVAYPADAERDGDGREVRCLCSGFYLADDFTLAEWGLLEHAP